MTQAPRLGVLLRATSLALLCFGCGGAETPAPVSQSTEAPTPAPSSAPTLEIVAEATRRWTGIAVDRSDQIYVNFPRWSDEVPLSVARVDGSELRPFPDAEWNECWLRDREPTNCWVCVQSVVVDPGGDLWVLDPGNPGFAGVVDGAPKLVRFVSTGGSWTVAQKIAFGPPVIQEGSYLNDVRFDLERGAAFITDSGDGALIVVDLERETARRLLDAHPSTEAEEVVLTIGGQPFDRTVHADGIAYDPAGVVYYQSLRGRTLYAIAVDALLDATQSDEALAAAVRVVGETGASDGLLFHNRRVLTTALEHDGIRAVNPATGAVEDLVVDPRIAWPDSLAAGRDGSIYFTTAQIHLGDEARDPFRVWRLSNR
ncbi:MAG: L-dopachrome tautomerase-related protein [Myxococcota bacterium]